MKCLQLCPTCRNNFISAQPQGSSLWMWLDRPSANWAVGIVCLLSFQLAVFIFPYPLPLLNLIQFLTCFPHPSHKIQLSGKALIDLFTVRSQGRILFCMISGWGLGLNHGFPLQSHPMGVSSPVVGIYLWELPAQFLLFTVDGPDGWTCLMWPTGKEIA